MPFSLSLYHPPAPIELPFPLRLFHLQILDFPFIDLDSYGIVGLVACDTSLSLIRVYHGCRPVYPNLLPKKKKDTRKKKAVGRGTRSIRSIRKRPVAGSVLKRSLSTKRPPITERAAFTALSGAGTCLILHSLPYDYSCSHQPRRLSTSPLSTGSSDLQQLPYRVLWLSHPSSASIYELFCQSHPTQPGLFVSQPQAHRAAWDDI